MAQQQRMGDAAPVAGAIDCSKEKLDKKWADAVYAVPTSFGFLENEFVVDAIEATSRYLLPDSLKSDPENAPKYTPPKRYRLATIHHGWSDAEGVFFGYYFRRPRCSLRPSQSRRKAMGYPRLVMAGRRIPNIGR